MLILVLYVFISNLPYICHNPFHPQLCVSKPQAFYKFISKTTSPTNPKLFHKLEIILFLWISVKLYYESVWLYLYSFLLIVPKITFFHSQDPLSYWNNLKDISNYRYGVFLCVWSLDHTHKNPAENHGEWGFWCLQLTKCNFDIGVFPQYILPNFSLLQTSHDRKLSIWKLVQIQHLPKTLKIFSLRYSF